MAFKIKDGVRIGLTDVFDNTGTLLVDAPAWITARTVTFATGDSTGSFNISGDADVGNVALTLNTLLTGTGKVNEPGVSYGSSSLIPVFTVDAKGRITAISEVSATFPSFTVDADSGSDTFGGGALSFVGGTGIGTVAANDGSTGTNVTINADVATAGVNAGASTLGVASFDSANFVVTGGWVEARDITLGTSTLSLGSTTTDIAGLTSIDATSGATSFFATPTTPTIFAAGTAITVGATTGTTTVRNSLSVGGDVTVSGDLTVNGTLTSINSATVQVEDKNIELGFTDTPTDATADGGGITLKGTTDKTINWVDATDSWTFSENVDLASGRTYKIAGVDVLSATTLGTNVVNSSLTSVGTLTSGTWNATIISPTYGGTGVNNGTNTITVAGNFATAGAFATTLTATGATNVTLPTTGTLATLAGTETFTNKTINASTIGAANPGSGTFTTLTANGDFTASGANAAVTLSPTGTGTVTINPATTGTIDNVNIGVTTAGTGRFTTLTATTSLTISSTTNATSQTTGALQIDGGISVDQDIFLSGNKVLATAGGTAIGYERAVQTTVATTTPTAIDTWAVATFRYASYIVQITQGSEVQISEVRVAHNGTTTVMTEYAVLEPGTGPLALAFTSDISGGNARLLVTMNTATSATVNIIRTLVVV
jgi:hypothetical protein